MQKILLNATLNLLLKDIVKNVVSSEVTEKKSVSDENYSSLKFDKWKTKFVFWDTKDGKVIVTIIQIHFLCFIPVSYFLQNLMLHRFFL